MTRAILRSFGIAAITLSIGAVADAIYIVGFCPQRYAPRAHGGRPEESGISRDAGYRFALPGEAIYACTTPHRAGRIVWHEDVDCYCAPGSMGPEAVGRLIGGNCVTDQPHPTRADEAGACRHSHCRDLTE